MLASVLQDPTVVTLATLVRDLAFVVHAGGIAAFALMAALSARVGGPPTAQVLRIYRGFGPGLGVSLGLTIFGALLAHYGTVGAFSWGTDAATGGWAGLLAWMVFFVAWVSNIQLEVWTLEPLRKLDPEGTGHATDAAGLDHATRRVIRHLGVQAGLWGLIVVLARFATTTMASA